MATAETVMAVYSDRSGVGGQGTGKPDETERLMSGLGRGRRKSAGRQLADALLYRPYGSVRGARSDARPYRGEPPQALADPCRRIQPGPDHAPADRGRDASGVLGADFGLVCRDASRP
jgi:hypothetical protein